MGELGAPSFHSGLSRSLLGPGLRPLECVGPGGVECVGCRVVGSGPRPPAGPRADALVPLQLKEWVQKLMMTLRHPSLPLLELQDIMTNVSGRIPAPVEKSVRRVMAQYASNITSVLCQFPSQQVCAPPAQPHRGARARPGGSSGTQLPVGLDFCPLMESSVVKPMHGPRWWGLSLPCRIPAFPRAADA